MGIGGQRYAPAALPQGKAWCQLYRRLGRPQRQCGRVLKISLPRGFHLRTVQPVASRYTNWAIPAPKNLYQIQLGVPNLIMYITALVNKSFSTRYYQVRNFRACMNISKEFSCSDEKQLRERSKPILHDERSNDLLNVNYSHCWSSKRYILCHHIKSESLLFLCRLNFKPFVLFQIRINLKNVNP